jgi:hypothetical protein
LYRSQTTTMYWSMRKNNYPDLRCVLIFDTQLNRFASGSGYLAADVPPARKRCPFRAICGPLHRNWTVIA